MKNTIRLFAGPMSLEIVNAVINYSENKKPMGLIPSRRQIEYCGGYVNEWKTGDFLNYVNSKTDKVLFVRDHAGPSQGIKVDDGIKSMTCDINSGFNIIHIDPWKTCTSIDEGIAKTVSLINYCLSIDENIKFEIGTEAAIFPYTPEDLDKFLNSVSHQLGVNFNSVEYAVVQSGVEISGTKNIGKFDARRLRAMVSSVKKYNLMSKEHNGDYLSLDQIRQRVDCGLDSINIAPEFGVRQTRFLIKNCLIDNDEAINQCLKTKKYHKWIPANRKKNPPENLIVEVSGHYSFTKKPFVGAMSGYEKDFEKILFERFEEIHSAWE
jgi:tagatose-1,6-bisphosphate aldolase non-catalytic subunit AgaZ/GatZ